MQQKIANFSFQTPPKYCCHFQNCQFHFLDPPKYYCQFQFQTPKILLKVIEQCLKTLRLIIFNYVGDVNGPTSITRHEVLKMQQRIASFSFQTPPQILLPVSELPVSVFRPPPPKLPVSAFRPPQNIVASFSFQTPPNIVKGNGVVFENFTINNI